SRAGLHARAVMKPEADHRSEIGAQLRVNAAALAKSFRGTKIAHYEEWDFRHLPRTQTIAPEFFASLADRIEMKTAALDIGFGWNVRDAIHLDRAEVLDAFAELEPLYRIMRSVL